jgi:hypothetical protein
MNNDISKMNDQNQNTKLPQSNNQDLLILVIWHNDSLLLLNHHLDQFELNDEYASYWFPYIEFNYNITTCENVENYLRVSALFNF